MVAAAPPAWSGSAIYSGEHEGRILRRKVASTGHARLQPHLVLSQGVKFYPAYTKVAYYVRPGGKFLPGAARKGNASKLFFDQTLHLQTRTPRVLAIDFLPPLKNTRPFQTMQERRKMKPGSVNSSPHPPRINVTRSPVTRPQTGPSSAVGSCAQNYNATDVNARCR